MTAMDRGNPDLFRELVESANCVIVILRSDCTIAFMNAFAERMTGYTTDEVLGKNYLDVFVPEAETARVAHELAQVFVGTFPSQVFVNAIRCHDNSLRWLEWNTRLLGDFDGRPAALALGHDITQHKQAAEQLRTQEARLRAVLDTAVDGIITIDEYGIIQSVNSAAEKIFRYTAPEMLGENIRMLMPPPYRDEHNDYIASYVRTGEKKIIGIGRDVEAQRKDGSVFPCNIAVSEVPLAEQRLFTGIIRDITAQKRTEERALQAERLAAIGQTVAGLAHESRNAFQRSQACLEMLALELEDRPEELELVARTQRALNHLHKLYEEVRDYAAPIILDRQHCDLKHLWRSAWAHLEIVRERLDIALEEDDGQVDLSLDVDWFAIGQVFRNIFENAIAACPQPGLIRVACRNAILDDQPAVEINIDDNGPGIDPAERDKVFDAFYTTKTKGTGLGLSIAKRIVEAHGGRITIGESASGARFRLILPR